MPKPPPDTFDDTAGVIYDGEDARLQELLHLRSPLRARPRALLLDGRCRSQGGVTGLDERTMRHLQNAERDYHEQLGLLVQVEEPDCETSWTTVVGSPSASTAAVNVDPEACWTSLTSPTRAGGRTSDACAQLPCSLHVEHVGHLNHRA